MKVTALIPDDIVNEVKETSGGKNITEAILIALKEYLRMQKMNLLLDEVRIKPLQFKPEFSAENIRKLNREH